MNSGRRSCCRRSGSNAVASSASPVQSASLSDSTAASASEPLTALRLPNEASTVRAAGGVTLDRPDCGVPGACESESQARSSVALRVSRRGAACGHRPTMLRSRELVVIPACSPQPTSTSMGRTVYYRGRNGMRPALGAGRTRYPRTKRHQEVMPGWGARFLGASVGVLLGPTRVSRSGDRPSSAVGLGMLQACRDLVPIAIPLWNRCNTVSGLRSRPDWAIAIVDL